LSFAGFFSFSMYLRNNSSLSKDVRGSAIVDLVLYRLRTLIVLILQMFGMFFLLIFYFDQIYTIKGKK